MSHGVFNCMCLSNGITGSISVFMGVCITKVSLGSVSVCPGEKKRLSNIKSFHHSLGL